METLAMHDPKKKEFCLEVHDIYFLISQDCLKLREIIILKKTSY